MRFRQMGMFPKIPDMGALQAELDEKFDMLYNVLVEIRDELRTQRGAPPPATMTGP